jgi:glycosyltransferase involved in cell wall biosynthesis
MDLIQHLDPARFRPLLVVPAPGPLVDWSERERVPYVIVEDDDWQSRRGLARRAVRLASLIRRRGVSIVHAVGPMAYRALGIAATVNRAVRVCHLGFPPEPGELARSFIAGPDAVIACYEAQAAEHREEIRRIRPACQVTAIPNGVDIDRFAPAPPSAEWLEFRQGYSTVVAILGHISDVKGYPTFLEAAASVARTHPSCLFVCIGGENFQSGARAVMESRARELGLKDNLRFLGFRSDVHEVLRMVDIVTMPSLDEGLPLALLEAMACGRPVIATPVGGIPEVLRDGVNGLLIPKQDGVRLAEAIAGLALDPPRRCTLGSQARASVEAYSIRRFARDVQSLYDSLLASRSRSVSEGMAAAL